MYFEIMLGTFGTQSERQKEKWCVVVTHNLTDKELLQF
jgi:hypothetical protein